MATNRTQPTLTDMNAWVLQALPSSGFDALRQATQALRCKVPLGDGMLFECHDPQTGTKGAVDISLRFCASDSTAVRFAQTLRSHAPMLADHPIWQRILVMMTAPDVGIIWLEFDHTQITRDIPIPGIFWKPLKGADMAAQIAANAGCTKVAAAGLVEHINGSGMWPDFMGLMLGREGTALRVCHRVKSPTLTKFNLPLTGQQIDAIECAVGQHPVMLSFDLNPDIQLRVGIEFDLSDPDVAADPASMAWAVQSSGLANTLADDTPSPLPGPGPMVFVRRANHRKWVFDGPGQPTSKIYLYLGVGWLP